MPVGVLEPDDTKAQAESVMTAKLDMCCLEFLINDSWNGPWEYINI